MDLRENKGISPVESGFPITAITMDLTKRCNLACDYCFAHCFNKDRDKADLKPELGKQIIDWVMREDVRGDSKHVSISFWGGEPLLKFDLMKELILYGEEKAKENGLTVEFGGTTNVTLLTEDKLDFLTEHKCYFLLSIDGRPEHHNMHRKTADGKGSYELVDRNLDIILKKWPNAKVRLSHSVETIDTFLDNLKFLYNKGFRDIAYSPVSEGDWNEERLQVLTKVWADIADWYAERIEAGDPVRLKFLEDACVHYYGRPAGNSSPCGAGRGYVGITVDGSIYPCHRFNKFDDSRPWYEREVCIGHINYGILNQPWRENFTKWDNVGSACDDCKKCEAMGIACTGGCWATNWDLAGTLSAPIEPSCTSVKLNMKLAAELDKKLGEKLRERFIGRQRGPAEGCVCYNVIDQEGTPNERMIYNKADDMSCICYNAQYGVNEFRNKFYPEFGNMQKKCNCKPGECNGECNEEDDEELKELKKKISDEENAIKEYLREQEKKILSSQLEELSEIRKTMELKND